jgi:hypothetical protein
MASRRSTLATLAALVRAARPGDYNIGHLLHERGDELAVLLGVPAASLRAAEHLPDDELAPHVEVLLGRLDGERRSVRRVSAEETSRAAAAQLARTATWRDDVVLLDVDVLLGALLADAKPKYIAFDAADVFDVAVLRVRLADARRVLLGESFVGLCATVDAAGLHLRWKDGRGGLDFRATYVTPLERDRVLRVVLERPRHVALVAAQRGSARLGDVLADLGFIPCRSA